VSLRKRIAVIDDDAYVLRVMEAALRGEGFEVATYEDPRDALAGMREAAPDLILCDVLMPFMDGRALFREVKETPKLKEVPFVFVSGVEGDDEIVDTLERGADDFVSKPFNMSRLLAKVRATLRLAERRHDALSGPIGPAGPLPLLKFCEDSRLSGRLSIRSGDEARWADFLGGELVQAGGAPEVAGEDPLDLLLAMETGTYRIEQRRLDPEALRRSESRAAEERAPGTPGPGFVPIPSGRLSMIRVRGQDIQVQTEGENRPEFTVTTVVARDGQVMRKVQSAWHHPFKRREDQEVARTQIDRQHDRVVAMLQGLAAEAAPVPVPTAPAAALGVDPSLLAWAISFVAEQVRDHLGAVMTLALLRGSLRRAAGSRTALRSFRVAEDGRVVPATTEESLPAAAVEAVAAWTADFLSSAGEIVDRAGGIRLRQATRMMEAELERIGFYAAFDAVVAAGLPPPRR
jgi:CheY-like chemotaxis protein